MKLSVAILAGGRAARFGHRPKGLALVGGRSVLERQLDVLESLCDRVCVVGDDLNALVPIIESRSSKVDLIADARSGAGPIAGLAAALRWSDQQWTFVVAGDMPLIDCALIDALVAAVSPDSMLVAPVQDDRVQPLAALYNRGALAEIERCLAAGLLSPRRLFERGSTLKSTRVVFDPACPALSGFNSTDELAAIERAMLR